MATAADSNPTTSVVAIPYLDDDSCDALLDALAGAPWERGHTLEPQPGVGSARKCMESRAVPTALIERLESDIMQINALQFGFELTGMHRDDPVVAMRYREGDTFDWHIDNGVALAPLASRKLSFSLQLSAPNAYTGGDLAFGMYAGSYGGSVFSSQAEMIRQRGLLVVFASFHAHRVAPVTAGERVAIVGWLHGPRFR